MRRSIWYLVITVLVITGTFVATIDATGGGPQTMSATYTLPAGTVQAVRARFRSGGSAMPCTGSTSGFDDHDTHHAINAFTAPAVP